MRREGLERARELDRPARIWPTATGGPVARRLALEGFDEARRPTSPPPSRRAYNGALYARSASQAVLRL